VPRGGSLMAARTPPRHGCPLVAIGGNPNGARTTGQDRSRDGGRGPRCSMRTWCSRTGADAASGAHTAWGAVPSGPLRRSGRRVAGRCIRPWWSGSTSLVASAWRRADAGATRSARAKQACAISWPCSRCITMSSCPTPVCVSRCRLPKSPTVVAQRRCGGRGRRRWPRTCPNTCGRCKRCCSLGCHRGRSHRRSKRWRRVMLVGLRGWGMRRGRPTEVDGGLKTRSAGR